MTSFPCRARLPVNSGGKGVGGGERRLSFCRGEECGVEAVENAISNREDGEAATSAGWKFKPWGCDCIWETSCISQPVSHCHHFSILAHLQTHTYFLSAGSKLSSARTFSIYDVTCIYCTQGRNIEENRSHIGLWESYVACFGMNTIFCILNEAMHIEHGQVTVKVEASLKFFWCCLFRLFMCSVPEYPNPVWLNILIQRAVCCWFFIFTD